MYLIFKLLALEIINELLISKILKLESDIESKILHELDSTLLTVCQQIFFLTYFCPIRLVIFEAN